ncbi:hypothetical protein HPT27_11725 [Permianibacter sp. IMCC34836]|uniref:PilW family protein n=1 Tax=Permianibacter fluminis TaxID=2738515 RepID=UPI001552F13C|nr:PilW family protein [Permianibacter fluminis]NQD37695.1 hypothetical protein [Permianibacter fluminis]
MKHAPQFAYFQRGYSVVELLIAGTLGLILLGGISQLFVGSSQTYRMQRQLANIQDSGRFALWYLKDDLQRAGWANDGAEPTSPLEEGPIFQLPDAFSDTLNCGGGNCTADGGGDANDSFAVRFEGTTDCTGVAVAGPVVQNYYYIGGVDNQQLLCVGNGGGTPQPLVDGVDSFQVLYGIDTTAPAPASPSCRDRAVDQYVTATDLADFGVGLGETRSVVAVRFSLLIRGEENNALPSVDRSYQVGDRELSFNDRIPRRVFSLTVPIYNRVMRVNQTVSECPFQ